MSLGSIIVWQSANMEGINRISDADKKLLRLQMGPIGSNVAPDISIVTEEMAAKYKRQYNVDVDVRLGETGYSDPRLAAFDAADLPITSWLVSREDVTVDNVVDVVKDATKAYPRLDKDTNKVGMWDYKCKLQALGVVEEPETNTDAIIDLLLREIAELRAEIAEMRK